MSVLDTIRRLSKSDVTLHQLSAAGSVDVNGRAVAASYVNSTFRASVQPTSGTDLEHLPEGEYTDHAITVWSSDQELTVGDELSHRGIRFKVVFVRRWDEFEGGWKALCVRAE